MGRLIASWMAVAVLSTGVAVNASAAAIDHSRWQALLDRYLVDGGAASSPAFDYAAVGADGREQLTAYLDYLGSVPYWLYGQPEQQAYWINLYNAVVVKLIVDHYPIESIDQIQFASGSWRDIPLARVAEVRLSIEDIERYLSLTYRYEPDLYFALSCGTAGCPPLARHAYSGNSLPDQLARQIEAVCQDETLLRFDEDQLVLSGDLARYQYLHLEDQKTLLRRLAYYAPSATALRLLGYDGEILYTQNRQLARPRL